MRLIDLKYGRTAVPFEYDEDRFEVLGPIAPTRALTDAEIGAKFDDPIGTEPLDNIVATGETVLIVVPDATREIGCGQVVNLIVRRLIANGINSFDIRIIFATGIHRKVTEVERASILTPFIAQRIKTLDHEPRDLLRIVRLGETTGGLTVELNRALVDHDHVILIGGASFHYFAGFTGGRKLICPGLASSRTVSATHKLAFDCEKMDRRDGVGAGLLDGNAVHESFVEAASKAAPGFAITTIVNDAGEIVDIFCGDWISSHRAACDQYALANTVELTEKRHFVVVSCGGFPHDINLIQAHKALDAASKACVDGGRIVLLAECSEGLGRDDFLDWFSAGDSVQLARNLCEKYQVNGQTAHSLLRKNERFDVGVVTSLPSDMIRKMRFRPVDSLSSEIEKAARNASGYIIPNGAKLNFNFSRP
ncbi:MAG: nickel-dependent lactate racemase [Acidobacteriota bacterium]